MGCEACEIRMIVATESIVAIIKAYAISRGYIDIDNWSIERNSAIKIPHMNLKSYVSIIKKYLQLLMRRRNNQMVAMAYPHVASLVKLFEGTEEKDKVREVIRSLKNVSERECMGCIIEMLSDLRKGMHDYVKEEREWKKDLMEKYSAASMAYG